MVPVLFVGIGGFAGAVARYLVDSRLTAWSGGALPWGTFTVNITGSFVLGLLFALLVERAALAPELRGPLLIGFLGSYTTFSTLALESWRMIEDGAWVYAALESVRLGAYRAGGGGGRRCDREGGLMKLEGRGLLVRIYLGESDAWHGRPLYQAIVERLRERGLAGATVLRGIEGFGAKQHLHSTRILSLSEDLPILVEAVDTEEKIRGVLPELDEMVKDGLITLEKIEVITYPSLTESVRVAPRQSRRARYIMGTSRESCRMCQTRDLSTAQPHEPPAAAPITLPPPR